MTNNPFLMKQARSGRLSSFLPFHSDNVCQLFIAQLAHWSIGERDPLGHTEESDFSDDDRTPRNIREVEAEGVALICCESLGLPGAEYSRGYIQHWLQGSEIPEKSAQRIFSAASQILRAGQLGQSGEESAVAA